MVLQTIMGILFGSPQDYNGADALKAALREPRKEVDFHGVYEEPRLDTQGARTAVFPVTVYDAETGEEYTETEVEFAIEKDDGKERIGAFLEAHGVGGFEDLDAIEGATADVTRTADGNIEVMW